MSWGNDSDALYILSYVLQQNMAKRAVYLRISKEKHEQRQTILWHKTDSCQGHLLTYAKVKP
jgi:hypothetical protein